MSMIISMQRAIFSGISTWECLLKKKKNILVATWSQNIVTSQNTCLLIYFAYFLNFNYLQLRIVKLIKADLELCEREKEEEEEDVGIIPTMVLHSKTRHLKVNC